MTGRKMMGRETMVRQMAETPTICRQTVRRRLMEPESMDPVAMSLAFMECSRRTTPGITTGMADVTITAADGNPAASFIMGDTIPVGIFIMAATFMAGDTVAPIVITATVMTITTGIGIDARTGMIWDK
jgi:hypothetical protein